jgi:hypothetical protein
VTPKEELAQLASARTESGVELFLAELGRHRLLSAAEEVRLAKRVERGDLAAKKQMVNANLRRQRLAQLQCRSVRLAGACSRWPMRRGCCPHPFAHRAGAPALDGRPPADTAS